MPQPNTDQAEYWSTSGQSWVEHQAALDHLLSEALEAVLTRAAPQQGERVLDIGCGTGASSVALSSRVGRNGHVTALDIAAPLLDLAGMRTRDCGNVSTLLGDAQTHPLPEADADLVFSRFGVMFFNDPAAAFANLLRATRQDGRLAMICWQDAPANPWFMLPMQAAVAHLGKPEPMDPLAPGPMAFKDIDRVTDILRDAGWADATGEKVEVMLHPPQPLTEAAKFATTIGPATRVLREKGGTEDDLSAIRAACEQAFAPFATHTGLRIPARLIVYTAHKPV